MVSLCLFFLGCLLYLFAIWWKKCPSYCPRFFTFILNHWFKKGIFVWICMGRIVYLDQKTFSVTIGPWGMGYFLSVAHSSWRIPDCHGHYSIKAMVFYGIRLVFCILELLAKLQQGISEVLLCVKGNGCLPDSLRDKIYMVFDLRNGWEWSWIPLC